MQEISKYGFIGAILFGVSFAAREKEHIRADIVTGNVSESVKSKLLLIADLVWVLFSLGLVWYSIPFIKDMASFPQYTPILHIPMWMLYMMVPISALLTAIRVIQNHLEELLKRNQDGGS